MFLVFLGWFPSVAFAKILGILVLAAVLTDEFIPVLMGGRQFSLGQRRDRGSSLAIQFAARIGFGAAVFLRYHNIGLVSSVIQVLAIVLLLAGTLIRDWALYVLGRFFSRSVRIEQGHRLITVGPYRWIRHPA